jgi:hypothetical protein
VTLATGAVAREHSSVADISAVHWADGVYASGGAGGEVEIVRPARWPARRLDTSTADGKRCRAIHAVPELEMMYAASHAGAIRRISWAEPRLQNATYRFHEEGVFSLDRSGPFLVAAVNTHVAIITYGVGRPYSGLFA